jgi:hypothetical protein
MTPPTASSEVAPAPGRHAVDPRVTRPVPDPRAQRQAPPARRDLYATYLDHMRRSAAASAAPHHSAHAAFCERLRIPEQIADSLWARWLRHYLRYGPDWC